MWIVYLYLIREVFRDLYLLADETFVWAFRHAPLPDLPAVFRFLSTLGLYGVVVVVNGMILIGWALYNQRRFRGRDSRKAIAAVSAADLGRYHGVSDDDIAQWQQARTLVIIHDAEGKLLAAMPKSMETTYWDHGDRPLDSPDTAPAGERRDSPPPSR
jgi:poly-beta-1,6-N-acetyl-D-glucosamine biosynthesis protein PgaD